MVHHTTVGLMPSFASYISYGIVSSTNKECFNLIEVIVILQKPNYNYDIGFEVLRFN
jgi:hypothetical protein